MKMFPIMGSNMIKEVPWALLAPHELNAQTNHGQSLSRLASRGGLSVGEALAIIEGRPWSDSRVRPNDDERLSALVAQLKE